MARILPTMAAVAASIASLVIALPGHVPASASTVDRDAGAAEVAFIDVAQDNPFAQEITWLASEGISTGWGASGEREFRPYASITRDAMAAFLYRLAGSPEVTLPQGSPFVDVSAASTQFYKEIVWLAQSGISSGWTGARGQEFRPHQPITRDAMAAFLYRYALSPTWEAPAAAPFADVSAASTPFYAAITWLAGMKVSTGWDIDGAKEYRPLGHVTRDAMAAFLYRFQAHVAPEAPGAPEDAGAAPTTPECSAASTRVSSEAQLADALADAGPGDVIALDDGRYDGNWRITRSGSAQGRIVLCGTAAAVLDGGSTSRGYVLHLDGADYWDVRGITVRNGMKGVMLDEADHVVLDGLTIERTGDEAVHLRSFSSDNVVRDCVIRDTGHRNAKFGEGIYVGSSINNWDDLTDGLPDRSDRNVIENNRITAVTAEAVDIKEGSSDGVVRGNYFDGSGIEAPGADSWVDAKGNDWLIVGNEGAHSPNDGFQTHEIEDGWGTGNVFSANTADVDGPGYGFSLTPVLGNTVACTNTVAGAREGFANVDCR